MHNLYRPVPVAQLQNNLAQYYERTSNFVDEHFDKLAEIPETLKKSLASAESTEEAQQPRLNPSGMGTRVDLYA
jgi:hypothetical protein